MISDDLRLRAPEEVHRLIHAHYDVYNHSSSGLIDLALFEIMTTANTLMCQCCPEGLPIEILTMDFWVPGSSVRMDAPEFTGKDQFRQILEVTSETTVLWVKRVIQEIDVSLSS